MSYLMSFLVLLLMDNTVKVKSTQDVIYKIQHDSLRAFCDFKDEEKLDDNSCFSYCQFIAGNQSLHYFNNIKENHECLIEYPLAFELVEKYSNESFLIEKAYY